MADTTTIDAPDKTAAGADAGAGADKGTQPDLGADKSKTGADAGKDGSLLDKPGDATKGGDDKSLLDKANPDKTQAEPTKPSVPETYADPKLPEGQTLVPELKQAFDVVAKELGLSQDGYQKIVDVQSRFAEAQTKQTMDAFSKQIQEWKDETTKELGADTEKALSAASKAIDTIFTDPKDNKAFRDMMTETGIGNWNLMVKAFTFVGKKLSEDSFVPGKPGEVKRKSTEDILFDHPTSRAGAS